MRLGIPSPLTSLLRPALRALVRSSDTLRLGQLHGFESGLVVDRIYAREANGRYGVGKLLDGWLLAQPASVALRERQLLVRAALLRACAETRANGMQPALLDLGSGPARAVINVLKRDAGAGAGEATALCIDLDGACLREGRRLAAQAQLDTLRFEWANANDMAKLARWIRPTLVVASGLYEYFSDEAVRASLRGVHDRLRPRACVFTAQVQRVRAPLGLNTLAAGGRTRVRPIEALEAWARGAGFARVHSRLTRDGVHAVFTLGD